MFGYYLVDKSITVGSNYYNGNYYAVIDYDYYTVGGKLILLKPEGCGCKFNFFALSGIYDFKERANFEYPAILNILFDDVLANEKLSVNKWIGLFYIEPENYELQNFLLDGTYDYYEMKYADLDGIIYDSFTLYIHDNSLYAIAIGSIGNTFNMSNVISIYDGNAVHDYNVRLLRLKLETLKINVDI